jgi:hypothetical protein
MKSTFQYLTVIAGLIPALAPNTARCTDTYVGGSLNVPNGGADTVVPFVILGEYNPSGPELGSGLTLPAGNVADVTFYGGNYDFTLYALAPLGPGPNANEQEFKVVDSETFSGSAQPGVQTLAVSGFSVAAGDLLGFAGIGPYYSQFTYNDAPNSDATYMSSFSANPFLATPPGGPGTTFTVGLNGDPDATYDYVSDYFENQGRNYGIGVEVATVPEPSSTLLMAAPLMTGLLMLKRSLKRNPAGNAPEKKLET